MAREFCPHCNPCLHDGGEKCRAPDSAPNGLADEIRAFLADAPKGLPHEDYRYGELLAAAEAALRNRREGRCAPGLASALADQWGTF